MNFKENSGINKCFGGKSPEAEEETSQIEELGGWSVTDADAKAYKALRDEAFEKEGYVEWDEQAVAYAIKENQFCEGRTLLLARTVHDIGVQRAVLMYRIEGDSVSRGSC